MSIVSRREKEQNGESSIEDFVSDIDRLAYLDILVNVK